MASVAGPAGAGTWGREMKHRMHSATRAGVLAAILVVGSTGLAAPAGAADGPTFVDPTARVSGDVDFGALDYVAPFARVRAGRARSIEVGDESNIQDSVAVTALRGNVRLGEKTILAHGAAVRGPAQIGRGGRCIDKKVSVCPSFVGFNSLIDGGRVQKDAMVLHLARVGSGVTIPSGRAVISGANVTRNSQVAAKTVPVTPALQAFMAGVIEVNVAFARGYTTLRQDDPSNVRGVNYDPDTAFNPGTQLPTIGGTAVRSPGNPNRIIGGVRLAADVYGQLGAPRRASLRADEGFPFEAGTIAGLGRNATWHALERSHIHLGTLGFYGAHSLVHGGATEFDDTTITGASFRLGRSSVFFRSRAGDDVRIGTRSLVQDADLASGARIPSNTIVEGTTRRSVEW